jgi:pseudaminic acid synthase
MKNFFKELLSNQLKPFIIAEISANHGGSITKAKKMIKAAKKAGVDAVKIQTYEADSMTINSHKEDFRIKHGIWKGQKLYDLYKTAQTPYAWHHSLFEFAKKEGILIFSTPFDYKGVDLLEKLKVPLYKIASFEITDHPLIEYIASKNKPILLSTGMSSEKDIGEALEVIKTKGLKEILLFHCISSYPAKVEDYNLNMIKTLAKDFKTLVGLSDHTLGIEAALASVALGAVAIEKHFKLSKNDLGPDSQFSSDPKEMRDLVTKTHEVWKGLGSGNYERAIEEKKNLVFRRSIYFIKDLKEGHIISKDDIKCIRPSFGLEPKNIKKVISKKTKLKIKKGDRVTWDKIE